MLQQPFHEPRTNEREEILARLAEFPKELSDRIRREFQFPPSREYRVSHEVYEDRKIHRLLLFLRTISVATESVAEESLAASPDSGHRRSPSDSVEGVRNTFSSVNLDSREIRQVEVLGQNRDAARFRALEQLDDLERFTD